MLVVVFCSGENQERSEWLCPPLPRLIKSVAVVQKNSNTAQIRVWTVASRDGFRRAEIVNNLVGLIKTIFSV